MKSTETGPVFMDPKPKTRNYKNAVIGILSLALFCFILLYLLDRQKSEQPAEYKEAGNQQLADLSTGEENDLRKSFDETLVRLDSVTEVNKTITAELSERNKEIASKKAEIRRILNSRNSTAAELKKAKALIASLNETITTMEQEVTKLKEDNQMLTQERDTLVRKNEQLNSDLMASTELNEALTEKVDIGSTLNASDIQVTPVQIRKNDREKVTHSAKRVDKFMISFNVNNRIATPGTADLYVAVIGPDGKLITGSDLGSGSFITREEGNKEYTTRLPVEVEPAKSKFVEFSFDPGIDFQQGNYTIQIYQNGYMIGEGSSELKKGGLFG